MSQIEIVAVVALFLFLLWILFSRRFLNPSYRISKKEGSDEQDEDVQQLQSHK